MILDKDVENEEARICRPGLAAHSCLLTIFFHIAAVSRKVECYCMPAWEVGAELRCGSHGAGKCGYRHSAKQNFDSTPQHCMAFRGGELQ